MKKNPDNYRHGNLSESLVSDALDLLKTTQLEDLSLRNLAVRAGVSPRAPYVHFPTKKDLVRQIAIRGFRELADRSYQAGFDLVALGKVYLSFAAENPNLYRLMFNGQLFLENDCPEPKLSFDHLLLAIQSHHPELQGDELALAGCAVWSFVHGVAELRLNSLIRPEGPDCSFESMGRVLSAVLPK